jgi:hypothetical protein
MLPLGELVIMFHSSLKGCDSTICELVIPLMKVLFKDILFTIFKVLDLDRKQINYNLCK